jgi:hypothetical protein
LKAAAFALIAASVLCSTLAGEPRRGTICVLAQPAAYAPGVIYPESPGFSYNPATLKFRIDKQPVVSWPHKTDLKIEGLDVAEKHTITIYSDGKQIQSTRFRIADFEDAHICFFYDGYGGIQLGNEKRSVCRCK